MTDQADTTTTETTTETTEGVEAEATEQNAAQAAAGDTTAEDTTSDDAAKADGDDGTVLGGDTKSDDAAEGDTKEGGEEAAEGPPEEYALSLKDDDGNDIALDEDAVGEASEIFRELGLNNDQANKMVPLGMKMLAKGQESAVNQIVEAGAQQKKAWLDEFKADPEIGGKNREQTEQLAAKGLDALGFTEGHPFRAMLNETGFGNNVHMISAMRKIGEAAGEDGLFARNSAGGETEVVGWADRYDKTE